jgi:glycerophosphoryl diester phosphodiesterase
MQLLAYCKHAVITVCLSVLFGTMTYAQEISSLYLNEYTIPLNSKGAVISKIFNKDGAVTGAKILKDDAGLFTIRKGVLQLKKKVALPADGAFKYEVSIQAGKDVASFLLVKDAFIKNKVIAHRGAWKHHAGSENSITSLKDAIKLGCEGSEFDLWLSSDDGIIISHDPHIGGKAVEESTLADLRSVELKNGDHVPTFEEYLNVAMEQHNTKLVVEMKPSAKGKGALLATKTVALIHAMKAQAWVSYISFDYNILKKVLELDPTAKVAYLNGNKTPEELKADKMWGLDYHMGVFQNKPNLIQDAKRNGITTNVWTVDSPALMDALLKDGVDYITTNEPEILLEKVKK